MSLESESKRVKLQSDIFQLANTVKAEDGGVAAMRRAGLVKQRQQEETQLTQWIEADPARKAKYGEALPKLRSTYEEYGKFASKDLVVRNMLQFGAVQFVMAATMGRPKAELKEAIPEIAGGEPSVDREVLNSCSARRCASGGAKDRGGRKRFGALTGDARVRAEDDLHVKRLKMKSLRPRRA